MTTYFLTIHLHPSISSNIQTISGEVDRQTTLLENLLSILKENKEISDILIIDNDIRAGYLLISNKIELRTTKQLNDPVSNDMDITIIPISHGG